MSECRRTHDEPILFGEQARGRRISSRKIVWHQKPGTSRRPQKAHELASVQSHRLPTDGRRQADEKSGLDEKF